MATIQHKELVNRLVEITACAATEAENLLGLCEYDFQAAVALYFEQFGDGNNANNAENSGDVRTNAAVPVTDGNTDIDTRPPIVPVREQLIPAQHDFFSASTSRPQEAAPRVKICPLRDFKRESEVMEAQLQASNTGAANGAATSKIAAQISDDQLAHLFSSTQPFSNKQSWSNLGDLFRPPTDLIYNGNFQAARAYATTLKQWLLVNVQNDEFSALVLNRDVWPDKDMRRIIRRNFVFWQVDHDNANGRRFSTFYHCKKYPYVCVIDPRTGEKMWQCEEPTLNSLKMGLQQFLNENSDNSEIPSTSKRKVITLSDSEDESIGTTSSTSNRTSNAKRARFGELTEEEQLALAIQNSMREQNTRSNGRVTKILDSEDDDSESLDEFEDDNLQLPAAKAATKQGNGSGSKENQNQSEAVASSSSSSSSYSTMLGHNNDEITRIKIRLLDAAGTNEIITQLNWPSDTKMRILRVYLQQEQSHIPQDNYRIICAYPRMTLESEADDSTLKELGLHPSANLHVTVDDN